MRSVTNIDPESALRHVRAQVATLGAFDPSELLNPGDENHLIALQKLAPECDEVFEGGRALWMLRPDVRARTLHDLSREDLPRLLDTVQPAADDRFGQLLRAVLRKQAVESSSISIAELGMLRTALQLAGPALDTNDAARQVDLLLSRRGAEQATRVLLPRQLIGRDRELRKLRRFVAEDAGLIAENILWVTGAGGSGKSALLARFASSLRGTDWRGTPVLHIDFDRPAFRGTLASLMMELSRQLELFFPEMQPALSNFRRAMRSQDASPSEPSGFDQTQRREHHSSSTWRVCMKDHLPIKCELVLILDTAEELGVSSQFAAEEVGLSNQFDLGSLRRWLRHLRVREGLPKLKVVLSGRAFEDDQIALVPRSHRIELGDLQHSSAIALLASLLESKGAAEPLPLPQLVDMLGGNPLLLKILAAYLAEGGAQAAEELLSDRKDFDKRFAQSFLYKRILGRLRTDDRDLVRVAHPGLVLRRVTPELIQHVLARPCGLGNIGSLRARELFDRLAGQVWLVQGTTNPKVVVHRRDLRRLMLQVMTAEDEETALAIHWAAAEYYLRGLDPTLTPEEQRLEGLYHQLFTPGAKRPDPGILDAFARTLGEDLDSMPLALRAGIKLELGRKLSQAELTTLTESEQELYRSSEERKEVQRSGVSAQSGPAPPTLAAVTPFPAGDSRVGLSQLHAAFEAGDLVPPIRIAKLAAEQFARSIVNGEIEESYSDFTESAVWRAALATLRQVPDLFIGSLLEDLATVQDMGTYSQRLWNRQIIGASRGRLSVGEAYRMLFRLHGADCPEPPDARAAYYPQTTVFGFQDLRRFQLRDKEPGEYAQIPVRLLRDLSSEYRSFFADSSVRDLLYVDKTYLEAQERLLAKDGSVTLHDLIQLDSNQGSVTIRDTERIPRGGKDILLGRLPEIYPLVRAAARAASMDSLLAFASEAGKHPLWPVELAMPRLKEALATEREQWTATLIACVDRFGMLRRFVDFLKDRNRLSRHEKLLLMIVHNYELRLRHFI